MTCRQFEDGMDSAFTSVEREQLRSLLVSEDWDQLPPSEFSNHLATCSDCVCSLLQYFQARHRMDYHSHPCFHVAFYSAEVREKCLENIHGMYSIITDRGTHEGIVIGYSPWCGISLPTGV